MACLLQRGHRFLTSYPDLAAPPCLAAAEAVMIPDELTIGLNWKGQKREWSFDSVFGPNTHQDKVSGQESGLLRGLGAWAGARRLLFKARTTSACNCPAAHPTHPPIAKLQVFEDTKHLIQSAVDGYNVCIFACEAGRGPCCCCWVAAEASWLAATCRRAADNAICHSPAEIGVSGASSCIGAVLLPTRADGQTGSGKTFTIYGNDQMPGLTPRGVSELYHVMDRDSGACGWWAGLSADPHLGLSVMWLQAVACLRSGAKAHGVFDLGCVRQQHETPQHAHFLNTPLHPPCPAGKCSFRISCYMLELYCDDLADLLAEHKKGDKLVRTLGWGCWIHGQAMSRLA